MVADRIAYCTAFTSNLEDLLQGGVMDEHLSYFVIFLQSTSALYTSHFLHSTEKHIK